MGTGTSRMSTRVTTRDGYQLRVEKRGQGNAVLLVHGFMGSGAAWSDDVVDGLASRARVLVVDLLGHGASDRPHEVSRYALPEVVRDLLEVLDATSVKRASWVGYSMGGRIALGAAVLYPDRVRRLVLESASPGLRQETERAARAREDECRARKLLEGGIESFVEWWERRPLFADRLTAGNGAGARLRAIHLANDPAALAACLRGLGTGVQPSFWDHLRWLDRRTLVITGAHDKKFTAIAGSMCAELPRARHVAVPDAGHTVHLERPEAWVDAVAPFVA